MQQKATNKFIENANNFGNSYEKQIANAFEEILENEEEIKESIQALYRGPESFVAKADSNLERIEKEFESTVWTLNEEVKDIKKRLIKVSLISCGCAVGVCFLCAILLFINN